MDKLQVAPGAWRTRTTSSAIEAPAGQAFASRRVELLTLAGLGALAVVLHASVHLPLKLPGHHGLEWMAVLMFGRCLSRDRNAASTLALSAALTSTLPIWGFHESTLGLSYLLTGLALDAVYGWLRRPGVATLGACAALAHAVKPVWKLAAVEGLGLKFGSITAGFGYALACHLGFGLVGGVVGALAGFALRQQLEARR